MTQPSESYMYGSKDWLAELASQRAKKREYDLKRRAKMRITPPIACSVCGGCDLYPSGVCKPCQRQHARAHMRKRRAK